MNQSPIIRCDNASCNDRAAVTLDLTGLELGYVSYAWH